MYRNRISCLQIKHLAGTAPVHRNFKVACRVKQSQNISLRHITVCFAQLVNLEFSQIQHKRSPFAHFFYNAKGDVGHCIIKCVNVND